MVALRRLGGRAMKVRGGGNARGTCGVEKRSKVVARVFTAV